MDRVCKEYWEKYRESGVEVSTGKLRGIAKRAARAAERNYEKLELPRVCELLVYRKLWVREALDRGLVLNTLTKVDLDQPGQDAFSQALADFLNEMPLSTMERVNKELFRRPIKERGEYWRKLDLPTKLLEGKFSNLAKARNANKLGNQLELALKRNKIPKQDFEYFKKNVDRIIKYCSQQLPGNCVSVENLNSEFGEVCFVCKLKDFPFGSLDEARKAMEKQYPVLRKYRKKIKVRLGNRTDMRYLKKTDSFRVRIDRWFNLRHRALALIHELGHVAEFVEQFRKGKDPLVSGKYEGELAAKRAEFGLLKKTAPELYGAFLGEVLWNTRKVLFELELYKNPGQDLGKLYAEMFNRCFKGARQSSNRLYLIDRNFVTYPLQGLPHAVAGVKVLVEII